MAAPHGKEAMNSAPATNKQRLQAGQQETRHGLAERAAECRATSGLYRLLGRCLEEEVDAEFLALLKGPLGTALTQIGLALDELLIEADAEDAIAKLSEEFTALFVAPGAVSPYRSVFESGCTFQEPCDQAVAAYREVGLEFQNRYSGEFPDHIGVMLSFVGCLAEREAECLEAADSTGAGTWRARREKFLLEQLGPWASGWCRRARSCAKDPFYSRILELTESILWHDLRATSDRPRLKELERLNRRAPVRLNYDADFRKASGL
jgi:TorA maturation chaperone TorD